jgi:hypothetical protein
MRIAARSTHPHIAFHPVPILLVITLSPHLRIIRTIILHLHLILLEQNLIGTFFALLTHLLSTIYRP